MSEVFRRALKLLEEVGAGELGRRMVSGEFPEVEEGGYKVNFVVDSEPPLLGMRDEGLRLELTPAMVRHLMRFANLRGLTYHRVGFDVYLMRGDVVVAWIGDGFFAASEPELFEEIGREVYGIGGGRRMRFDKPVGWLDVPRLLKK